MENVLAKISSYNIFNYLLPGTLFAKLLPMISMYRVDHENLLFAAFLYYFIGMVISRIGSLFVEPFLKRIGFLKFADYADFVRASAQDGKLETLSEVNNTYRTICALILCVLLTWAYGVAEQKYPGLATMTPYVAAIAVFLLFLFSYRKQTAYITKRVQAHKNL